MRKKIGETGPLERAAYHEAGHAVAALFTRRGTRRVSIGRKDGSLGVHTAYPFGNRFRPDFQMDGRTRRIVEGHVIVCFGGLVAERRRFGRTSWVGAHGDARSAHTLASYYIGEEEELSAYLKWLRLRTENLLASPLQWGAVEALAAALLVERTIQGARAVKIMRDAMQALVSARSTATHS